MSQQYKAKREGEYSIKPENLTSHSQPEEVKK